MVKSFYVYDIIEFMIPKGSYVDQTRMKTSISSEENKLKKRKEKGKQLLWMDEWTKRVVDRKFNIIHKKSQNLSSLIDIQARIYYICANSVIMVSLVLLIFISETTL